jgi:hypothetical protein
MSGRNAWFGVAAPRFGAGRRMLRPYEETTKTKPPFPVSWEGRQTLRTRGTRFAYVIGVQTDFTSV